LLILLFPSIITPRIPFAKTGFRFHPKPVVDGLVLARLPWQRWWQHFSAR